ncbi:MAG: HPr family phosphocarrier protein [Lachnospiraceae bacterium]|nr:HPr family phosphocarrier protein [Lachnospiraceae bacterium]MCR5396782.1 HPr family phosphocarrier protein [Lachnospiraceae bacterium]MCR5546877.1 HPr family phosphocarrier protein [Lachnospiraceae bacterium]
MKSVKININSIDKVKAFVNVVTRFDNDFDLIAGRYVIDAKSIMGIFSLDLSQDLELVIQKDTDIDAIMDALKDFIVG